MPPSFSFCSGQNCYQVALIIACVSYNHCQHRSHKAILSVGVGCLSVLQRTEYLYYITELVPHDRSTVNGFLCCLTLPNRLKKTPSLAICFFGIQHMNLVQYQNGSHKSIHCAKEFSERKVNPLYASALGGPTFSPFLALISHALGRTTRSMIRIKAKPPLELGAC